MVSLHTNKTETKATTLKDRPHDQLLMTNTKELHGIFVDFFFLNLKLLCLAIFLSY